MSCTITEHEVQVVVIPDDCNAEPVVITAVDGTAVSYEPEPTVIEVNAGPRGLPGFDVELQKTATHVQWRLNKDGAPWQDLVPLSELVGPTPIKAGGILFSVASPGPDWVLCDGSLYTGGGPLATALAGNGGYLPDFTGAQVPAYISKSVGATVGWVTDTDARLTDAREWTAATVDQPEAEAGTATTRRAWTAQRVRQAMLGWWGGFAAKATPVDADSIVIADSAASNAPKRLTWANAVAKLRGTFVEGPASSVDGQVMVFDGATGKKAKSGGVRGAFAYQDYVSPKFDGGKSGSNLAVNISDFTGAPLLYPYNGSTISQAGKFIHSNSDFGGTAGAMAPTVVDLINAAGRTFGNARYGVEFIVCEISVGAGTSGALSVGGDTYYLASVNSTMNFYGIDGYATFFMWVRAVGQPCAILKRSDLLINGVAKSANTAVTPADGWVHCQHSDFAPNGYSTGAPYLYGIPGGKIQIALPMAIPKRVTTWTKHVAPVPYGGLSFF